MSKHTRMEGLLNHECILTNPEGGRAAAVEVANGGVGSTGIYSQLPRCSLLPTTHQP